MLSYLLAAAAILFLAVMFTVFWGAPYVPSRKRELRKAFTELYPLGKDDMLLDLGSGDGVVLRVAREFGATAVGYELSPVLVLMSKLLAWGDENQTIQTKNYWNAAFPRQTTVVYAFSDGRDIAKLYRLVMLQATRLARPLLFISYGFSVPHVKPQKRLGAYFLYTVNPCDNGEA